MPSTLRVQLLGGCRFVDGEELIKAVSSTALQVLLAYLLLKRHEPQSRQHLSFLLWPDSSDSQAQANLRTLLARLRRAWPDTERFLHIDQRMLQWRADAPFSLDVIEFETAIAQASQLLDSNPIAAQEEFERAVHTYHGDLLPDCYDNWILPERERLRQMFLKTLQQLIELLERKRDIGAALGYAQRLLQLDPLEETTYQQVMRLHAMRGDRAGVIRIFDTCAAVLQRELAVEPGPATCTAYESLLRMEPPALPVDILPRPANHNLPYSLTSFIGRGREIDEVKQLLRAARLLTLTGAGGSGKTRLALQTAFAVVADYPDGAWWVDLAPLADPWMVSRTVASVLGVQEQTDPLLMETLASALGSRRLLLVLDNCEHLVSECARLASYLLSACPNLTILATSREALGLNNHDIVSIGVNTTSFPD